MSFFGKRWGRSWLGTLAFGLVALGAAATASAAHPTLTHTSGFLNGSEGWYYIHGGSPGSMTWSQTGGNPNGYITTAFSDGNGVVQSSPTAAGTTWPAGNAAGDYGGTLGADIYVHVFGASSTEDLLIGFVSSNASDPLCEDLGAPAAAWTTYAVTLDTSHLIDCVSGLAATGPQVTAALAGFEEMFISAGNLDSVPEAVNVDNAVLAPPQSGQTPPVGKVTRSLTLAYKSGKLTGSLVAAKDYSCAEKARLTIFEKGKKPVRVGTVTTSAPNAQKSPAPATFSFKLKKIVRGSYYATVGKTTSSLDGNSCSAARSRSVKVH